MKTPLLPLGGLTVVAARPSRPWVNPNATAATRELVRRSPDTNLGTISEPGPDNEEPRDTEVSTGEVPEWARRDSNARPLAPEASALSN